MTAVSRWISMAVLTSFVALSLFSSPHAQSSTSATLSFSTTTAQAVATFDAMDYGWVSVHILTQGGSSTLAFQASNDNVNWVTNSLLLNSALGGSIPVVSTTGAAAIFHGPIRGRYFRLSVTGIVSGTTAGVVMFQASSSGELTSAVSITPALTPGTAAGNLGKAEDGAHTSADTGVQMLGCRHEAATQVNGGATDYTCPSMDGYGATFSRVDHPNRIHCTVTVSTATTLTAVGGSCATPGAGLSIYVTDILFATNAGAIAADSFNTLKYGTGGTCGSGTAVFWGAMNTAAVQTTTIQNLKTPIKIPANNEVCWINSTAGSKFITIDGFIAP